MNRLNEYEENLNQKDIDHQQNILPLQEKINQYELVLRLKI